MPKHIYFDLDGTLTDPYEGITKSILYALDTLGVASPGDDALRAYIGPPLQATFGELVGTDLAGRALELYRERFADVGWQENVPYDGIHDALDALAGAGHTLFVATTKPHVFAKRIVAHFGMGEYFNEVFGSELDGARVDKTELLRWALPQNSAGASTVMLGDRMHDMLGARNNAMSAVGATWGYGSVEELEAHGAERLVHSPADAASVLA